MTTYTLTARRQGDRVYITATAPDGTPVRIEAWHDHLAGLTPAARRAYLASLLQEALAPPPPTVPLPPTLDVP